MNYLYGKEWISNKNQEDLVQLNIALDSYLHFKKNSIEILEKLIKKKPNFLMANCLLGFLVLLTRDKNKVQIVKKIIKKCNQIINGASNKEIKYFKILNYWSDFKLYKVSNKLLEILKEDPKDILSFRLYHFNQIFLGIDKSYLENHLELIKNWKENDKYYNLVLGMTSFSYEENNQYERSKKLAIKSLNISKDDLWSWHALAHYYDSKQENFNGINLFSDINWNLYGPMKRHLWWHKSLFYFYNNEYEKCLNLYDNYVFDENEFYLDFCNAVSILIRLMHKNVNVISRMKKLKKIADYYLKQNSFPFIDFHILLFYYFLKDRNIEYFDDKIFNKKYFNTDFSDVYKRTLKPLIELIKNDKINNFNFLSNNFNELGGSFAQRELIHLSLINISNKKFNGQLNNKIIFHLKSKKNINKLKYV